LRHFPDIRRVAIGLTERTRGAFSRQSVLK
jgi:hypothetical protein